MQSLVAPIRPRFTSSTWLRAFSSSSSSSDYSNQSRGGLPRFFSERLPSSKGGLVRLQDDEFWHMTKVLRLRPNDMVELFNGKGCLVRGVIQTVDRSGLDFMASEDPTVVLPHSTQWHVYAAFGTLNGGRADWLVEKCTELGASSVTPLLTERSPSLSGNRLDRLQRVNMAAAKQCQRLHEMLLNPPMKIDGLLPIVEQSKLSFLAVAEATPLVTALTSSRRETSGLIVVGPEGVLEQHVMICTGHQTVSVASEEDNYCLTKHGTMVSANPDFTEKEVKDLIKSGCISVGLGPHRLRVETATVALLATLMLWSDSQGTCGS